jgi:hypothetical protein
MRGDLPLGIAGLPEQDFHAAPPATSLLPPRMRSVSKRSAKGVTPRVVFRIGGRSDAGRLRLFLPCHVVSPYLAAAMMLRVVSAMRACKLL